MDIGSMRKKTPIPITPTTPYTSRFTPACPVPPRPQVREQTAVVAYKGTADKAEVDPLHLHEYNIGTWNFVSPTAITEEYMESVYQCVSAI